ncbi:hypothetical protein LDENG_00244090 [Lucifuga dentata]|nr:hypothetical protein LDENG_00244090 [Lucifuga dentata]
MNCYREGMDQSFSVNWTLSGVIISWSSHQNPEPSQYLQCTQVPTGTKDLYLEFLLQVSSTNMRLQQHYLVLRG